VASQVLDDKSKAIAYIRPVPVGRLSGSRRGDRTGFLVTIMTSPLYHGAAPVEKGLRLVRTRTNRSAARSV